ncbi:MAG: PilC/PilY family type IV pilus protein [Pseudomonadales bacterium]
MQGVLRSLAAAALLVVSPVALALIANDDAYVVNEDEPLLVAPPGVLGNDDPDGGDAPVAISVVQPANGSVSLDSDGSFSYTPDPDYFGPDSFDYTATNSAGPDTATVTITVNPVNDAPSFSDGGDVSVDEDSGAHIEPGWADAFSAGPANETGQTFSFAVTGNTNPGLFDVGPAVDGASGDLTFTPAADAVGSADITIVLSDSGGTANGGVDSAAPVTFTITVNPVNDPPSFTVGPDQTVLEDAGPQSVAGWATGMSAGPADESGQTLTFIVDSNTNPSLFASAPAVDATTGTLTYAPAVNANGSATIGLALRDNGGGTDTSPVQTFVINVTSVNDAPSFVPGGNVNVDEDAGAVVRPAWAGSLIAGPPDESGQTLSFAVTGNTNPALFSAAPAVSGTTGDLTFSPAADAVGSADITVVLSDDGGTANGGLNSAPAVTFTITVGPVNDPPSFTPGGSVTVAEDAGPQVVSAWASGMSAGPADESGQTLTFNVVGNSNPALFSALPTVDAGSGDLSFTSAANANGSASVQLQLQDNGGGTDTSPIETFSITVTPENDPPFVASPISDVSTFEDGPDVVVNLAGVFDDVDIATNGDALALSVSSNSNPGLFTSVNLSGSTLTFDLAFDQNGSAIIEVTATDGGGLTVTDSFTITVSGVNDIPLAQNDAVTMDEDSPAVVIPVMCNDYLAETPTRITQAGVDGASESAPTTITSQLGDAVTAPNGSVTILTDGATCGSLIVDAVEYRPKADFYGSDFFTYTITDVNGDTSTATVNITVVARNDAPVGVQQRDYIMQENGSLTVDALSGLLSGAYDADGAVRDSGDNIVPSNGDPLNSTITVLITTFPSIGTLSVNQTTGSFTYTPPVNYTGPVDFEYRLRDGVTQSPGDAYRVTVTVVAVPPPPAPPPAGEVSIIYNLANAPLEQSVSVPPNVLVVMDDSGSMDWQMIVAEEAMDGGFLLDNSSRANSGRRSTTYVYLWDLRNNAYPDSSTNGRILATPEALEADSDTDGNQYGVWRARNHLFNRIYYNPAIQYTPWIGQDASNVEFADANPSSVRLDPRNPSNNNNNRIDILAPHSYRSTSVPEWDNNGGTTNVNIDNMYIPHYYTTTATPPLAWNSPHTKVEIRPGTGPLAGGLFPGGPERDDCAVGDGNPNTCTYAQEIQNFANFFQYYRSREYVTKNGIGKTVSQLQDIRIGYLTISNTGQEEIREMNALHTEGNKKALLDNIYSVDSFGGTPLRQALGRAGDVFACNTGQLDCPLLPQPEGSCQQNFALLFSDGYWNGGGAVPGNHDGNNSSPFDGGRYADNVSSTLADVAMYFYENDLHPTIDDQVPLMRRDVDGVPSGVFTGPDPKMHQHMKTYSIAFGVSGTVDPASVPANPTTPFAWPNSFDGNLEKIDDMLHAAINGRGRFLNAGTPTELQAAFESAFLEFTQAASSTSAAAFNSTSLQEGTLLYRGFYDLRDNTGELTATLVNPDGSLAAVPTWRASERLNPGNKLPNNRVIVTFDPSSGGRAFRYASMNADQQGTLNAMQVDYLRGIRTSETPAGPLRERPASDGLLGDIVNSSPVFVGAPRAINRDQRPYPTDDLYSQFASAQATRTPVVYVGANDGMLHGFNGVTGDELFAFVPNKIIDSSQGHKNPLDLFTSPFYQHRYYVDLSPRLNDVYMRSSRSAVGKSWNTVLLGGLGVGGKGFFALNVTRPDTTYASEVAASSAVLWEFTDEDDTYPVNSSGTPLGGFVGAITDPLGAPVKDLGYAVSQPVVAMSNVDDGGSPSRREWVALFGNGPNSTAGIAKLFVLFLDRGLNGWGSGDFVKLDTGFGVQSPPHPLAGYPNYVGTPAAVDTDLNGTVDRVYAGDRLGNLFRFDLSDTDPGNWTVTRLFTATYDDGGTETVQPIVTEPLVIRHPTERGFLVIFGTGSYVTRSDADSSDIQSIYAIWDEGSTSPATAQADTKDLRLVEQTITNVMDNTFNPPVVRRIVSRNPVNYEQEGPGVPGTYGWYIDLDMVRAVGDSTGRTPPSPQFPGEKAIRRLLFRDGAVITTTVLPSLDEFSCFGTRPGSILLFDAATGGDAGRPVVDFNTDGYIDDNDLVDFGGESFAGGLLFNQSDLDGQLVDLSTLGGQGDTDFLFVSGGNQTISFQIENLNDSRTGRLSWREMNMGN